MSRPATRERLDDHLSSGSVGCFRLNAVDRELRLYLMDGAIVAAHSSADEPLLLRRLVARGEIDLVESHQLAQEESEVPLFDRLIGRLEEKRLEIAFFDRFRDNLTLFISTPGDVDYTPMDSIMVPNIQLSHDTSQLLQAVDALVDRTRPIRERLAPGSIIFHGENSPQHLPEQELSSLLGEGITLETLLHDSPFEYFETLDILGDMLISNTANIGEPAASSSEPQPLPQPVVITPEVLDAATNPAPPSTTDTPPHADPGEVQPAETVEAEPAVAPPAEAVEAVAIEAEPAVAPPAEAVEAVAIEAEPAVAPPADSADPLPVEVESVEDEDTDPKGPGLPSLGPRLRLASPGLAPAEARKKIEVTNEVLRNLAVAFDSSHGHGSGAARIQLLVDGTSSAYSMLYHKVEVAEDGAVDTSALLANLRRRPEPEHMRLVNDGLLDLVERVLSAASDELPSTRIDSVLESVVGYQKRILS